MVVITEKGTAKSARILKVPKVKKICNQIAHPDKLPRPVRAYAYIRVKIGFIMDEVSTSPSIGVRGI